MGWMRNVCYLGCSPLKGGPHMRKPFSKNIQDIPMEGAHGGSGRRQLLLSKDDAVSKHFQAMTKGYLEPKGIFDWHDHAGVDEFLIVLEGEGEIRFKNGSVWGLSKDKLVYIPANTEHCIENTGSVTLSFYFVRLDA